MVAEAVRASVTIEVLKGGRAGEFQYGTYPLGNPIFSLYAIRNSKRVIPVRGVVQQADTCKGSKIPAYLFLPGISAAKDIPQQIRMDMVAVSYTHLNNNARTNAAGGNDYYESAVVNPDLVLRDLVKIFHPELVEEDFVYYKQLK